MNELLRNEYLGLAIRFFLGMIFLVASIDKIADPAAFAVSIGNYRLLPDSLLLIAATWLPWMELLCGLGLIFGILFRGASLLTLIMLLIFTLAIVSGLLRGLDISCGCFTQDPAVAKLGWWKVAENLGLIILAAAAFVTPGSRFLRYPVSPPTDE